MNRKAWIQVVEASIAVIIMISFVMIIMNKARVQESSMQEKANMLVLQIEKDNELRNKIFEGISHEDVEQIVGNENFAFKIDNEIYGALPAGKDIYSASIIINKINEFKTFTLYVWE